MNIVTVVYDDLGDCDIKQNLIDYTRFKVQSYEYNTIVTDKLTETLLTNVDNYDWAVVIAAGTYVRSKTIVHDTIAHAQNSNSPLSCHIIDQDGMFYLHPQWFAINLKVWRDVGSPPFEQSNDKFINVIETQRSTENFHDNYTPYWIAPSSESKQINLKQLDFSNTGVKVIAALLNHGHTVVNVPEDVRKQKFYSYPLSNYDDLNEFIKNPDRSLVQTEVSAQVYYYINELYNVKKLLDKGYYVLNTEPITLTDNYDPVTYDNFIGVCGGLKPAFLLGKEIFTADCNVVLLDVSTPAILWQKFLIQWWDGDVGNFESIHNKFIKEYPVFCPIGYKNITDTLTNFILEESIDQNEFKKRWKKYCALDHKFIKLNLLGAEASADIADIVNQYTNSYIWVSNSFYMDHLTFYHTSAGCKQFEQQFLTNLQNLTSSNFVLESSNVLYKK